MAALRTASSLSTVMVAALKLTAGPSRTERTVAPTRTMTLTMTMSIM
jgi:hypothetical protein